MNLNRIYTRTGDDGQTHLGDVSRVDKVNPQVEALGDIDELNVQIGVALAAAPVPHPCADWLRQIQNELFDAGADSASRPLTTATGNGSRPLRTRMFRQLPPT